MKHLRPLLALAAALLPLALTLPAMAAQPQLRDLSPKQAQQVRCTMLAGLVLYEHKRGKMPDARGVNDAVVDHLGSATSAMMEADHGIGAVETKALLKADFEAFTAAILAPGKPKFAEAELEKAMTGCASIWAAAATGAAASPAPHGPSVTAITPAYCYALNARFADAIRQKAGRDNAESMAFSRAANRIEAAVMAPHGDDVDARVAEEAMLLEALENFDVGTFDALPETEAEAIMTRCQRLAGADE
jgi:hypothetical protein